MFVQAKPIKSVYEDERNLIKRLKEALAIIADYYNGTYEIEEFLDESRNIAYTDLVTNLKVKLDTGRTKFDFVLVIPRYSNGVTQLKGVRRYFQKQIKDNLFIPASELKLMMGDLFLTIEKGTHIELSRIRLPIYMVYKYFIKKYNLQDEWEPYITTKDTEIYEQYKTLKNSKKNIFTILASLTAENKVRRLLETIELMYILYEDYLKNYSESLPDLLFKAYLMYGEKPDNEYGLTLTHRRLRSQTDILFDAYIYTIVNTITSSYTSRKKKTSVRIEPTNIIYEFIIMEQFIAPLASLADINRATIIGRGGFQRESIPISKRDLHPTHYMNLDPCVTPDRDNAGIVLYLATGAELDEFGRFKSLIEPEQKLLNSIYERKLKQLVGDENEV